MEMTNTEKAYLAGLFDGEGCIYITAPPLNQRDTKYQLLVHISNNYRPIIDELHERYGGTIQRVVTARKNVNFTLHFRSRKAAELLRLMLPYLRIKKEQAVLALEFQEHMSLFPRGTHPLPEGTAAKRHVYHLEMKRLKKAYFQPLAETDEHNTESIGRSGDS